MSFPGRCVSNSCDQTPPAAPLPHQTVGGIYSKWKNTQLLPQNVVGFLVSSVDATSRVSAPHTTPEINLLQALPRPEM